MLKPKRERKVSTNTLLERQKTISDGEYGIMCMESSVITAQELSDIKTGLDVLSDYGIIYIKVFPYDYDKLETKWLDTYQNVSEGQIIFELANPDLEKDIEVFNVINNNLSFNISLVDKDLNIIKSNNITRERI